MPLITLLTILLFIAISKIMKRSFNCVFFGFLFLIIAILNIHHITIIHDSVGKSKSLYLTIAILQTTLMFLVIGGISYYLKPRVQKHLYFAYIGLVFVFLVLNVIDFVLIRFMDLSIWNALDFIFEETWENFIEMLRMSGIPLGLWIVFAPFALLLPVIGVMLYRLGERYNRLHFSSKRLFQGLCIVPVGLFTLGAVCVSDVDPKRHQAYARALPFKRTFIEPMLQSISLNKPVLQPLQEPALIPRLDAAHKPNIYLFVVESLRVDDVNFETAPNLTPMSQRAIAGGNGTQISWYSIFHANNPLTWSSYARQNPTKGALPLRLFKEMGYKIHCHTAANLRYYKMDELIFGENAGLIDHLHNFPHKVEKPAWISDHLAMKSLEDNVALEGNVHIIFLDSTHFYYSWDPAFEVPFKSYAAEKDLSALPLLRNRYRNSVAYVDHLIGNFFEVLKTKGLYDDAIIAVTGDHGEEFYEEGNLFHASNLSAMQCEVPLFFKLGKQHLPKQDLISHLDIMPTMIEYITGERHKFWDGHSLFNAERPKMAITARYNAGRNPAEFVFYTPDTRVVMRLDNHRNIFKASKLEFLTETTDLLVDGLLEQVQPWLCKRARRVAQRMGHVDAQVANQKLQDRQ